MFFLFKSFIAESGDAANCKFVSNLLSSLFLLLLYMYLDICIDYLYSVESHLHIFTAKYTSIWQIV